MVIRPLKPNEKTDLLKLLALVWQRDVAVGSKEELARTFTCAAVAPPFAARLYLPPCGLSSCEEHQEMILCLESFTNVQH
ncbi:hypothetical protein J1614_006282 [Plenodomus biglobosus]|nr:hypothetical protein J1614_006282 [Plenodomus biglobosus]